MDRHADTRPLCQPPTKLFEYNPAVNQQQQVSINLRFGGPARLPGQQAASLVWYGPRLWTKILKVPVAFSFDLPFTKRFDWPSLSSVHPPSHPLDKREIFSRPLLTSNEFQNLGAKDLWPVGRINKKNLLLVQPSHFSLQAKRSSPQGWDIWPVSPRLVKYMCFKKKRGMLQRKHPPAVHWPSHKKKTTIAPPPPTP